MYSHYFHFFTSSWWNDDNCNVEIEVRTEANYCNVQWVDLEPIWDYEDCGVPETSLTIHYEKDSGYEETTELLYGNFNSGMDYGTIDTDTF